MRNTFIAFVLTFAIFSPMFVGCATSHDIPPARLMDECGIVDDSEPVMYSLPAQSEMLNAALADNPNVGICFVHFFDRPVPVSMVQACADYIALADSCEDARLCMEVCYACGELYESSL